MTRTKQLMRENNAFERALSPEFNQVLTDMVVYLRSAPVSEYNQELVRRDIGRMFLDAQRRGDSPADVIGEDYRRFCDQVLAEVPRLTVRERVLDGLSTSLVCLGAWGVIWPRPTARPCSSGNARRPSAACPCGRSSGKVTTPP